MPEATRSVFAKYDYIIYYAPITAVNSAEATFFSYSFREILTINLPCAVNCCTCTSLPVGHQIQHKCTKFIYDNKRLLT